MKYVDKNLRRTAFDAYTRSFISNQIRRTPGVRFEDPNEYSRFTRYKKKGSSAFSAPYNNGWLQILIDETDSRCCYCMARIEPDEVSVEHLVPKDFNGLSEEDEMRFYVGYAPDLFTHLMTGREFDDLNSTGSVDVKKHMRMPHIVAHINLFPSCCANALCKCNSHRHNHRILPMMLMPDVGTWTGYSVDGKFQLKHPDVVAAIDTLTHLDLNSDTLKKIRHLWYLFSRKALYPTATDGNSLQTRDSFIRQALGITVSDMMPAEFSIFLQIETYYWDRLLRYDWFYHYYLDAYPLQP